MYHSVSALLIAEEDQIINYIYRLQSSVRNVYKLRKQRCFSASIYQKTQNVLFLYSQGNCSFAQMYYQSKAIPKTPPQATENKNANQRPPKKSPRRTQRPVESSLAIHVLPILGLLILVHRARIVPHDFLPLCRAEPAKAHHGLHGRHVVVALVLIAQSRRVRRGCRRRLLLLRLGRWFGGASLFDVHAVAAVVAPAPRCRA